MAFRVFEREQGIINVEDDGPGKTVQSLSLGTLLAPSAGFLVGGTASIGGNLNVAGQFSLASLAGFQGITVAGTASLNTLIGTGAASYASTVAVAGTTTLAGHTDSAAASLNTILATGAATYASTLTTVGTFQGAGFLLSGVASISRIVTINASTLAAVDVNSTFIVTGAASLAGTNVTTFFSSGATSIGGTTQVPALLATGTASFATLNSGAHNMFGAAVASSTLQAANHFLSGGTAINATNGAASAAIVAAGTFGNDLAGRVAFLSTAAAGGAQVIQVFANAFPTNPYAAVFGAGNASFQAGFPTVTTSTNSMTVSLTLAPVVGASLAYNYFVIG